MKQFARNLVALSVNGLWLMLLFGMFAICCASGSTSMDEHDRLLKENEELQERVEELENDVIECGDEICDLECENERMVEIIDSLKHENEILKWKIISSFGK